jgi:hypothetical protein
MDQNIELSNEQYKSLVKLVFYGDWILHANKIGEEGRDRDAEELLEYIFSQKKKFSLESWFKELKYGEELKEEIIMNLLEEVFEYNEETFWFYLIKKLAERDTLEEIQNGGEFISEEEQEEIQFKYEEKYEEVFKYKEIGRLQLKNKE